MKSVPQNRRAFALSPSTQPPIPSPHSRHSLLLLLTSPPLSLTPPHLHAHTSACRHCLNLPTSLFQVLLHCPHRPHSQQQHQPPPHHHCRRPHRLLFVLRLLLFLQTVRRHHH